MRRAICTALLLALGHASAAPVAPAVRSEIDALLGRLVSSPGNASSTVSRSRPKSLWELERRTFLPVRVCVTLMSRSNLPEQMRMKARRSRCFGSMFA